MSPFNMVMIWFECKSHKVGYETNMYDEMLTCTFKH